MTMIEDIALYVETQLPSLERGKHLFGGVLPERPYKAVALIESTSMAPMESMGGDTPPSIERPRLQVLVRDSDYASARDLSELVYKLLQVVTMQTINSTLYHRIASIDMPELINRDEKQHPVFSFNFDVWKEPS